MAALSESPASWYNSIAISIVTAGIGTLLTVLMWYASNKRAEATAIAASHEKLLNRVVELESQLKLVNQAVVPISAAFQAILIKDLTHAHTPEIDELLRKIGPPFILTDAEVERLVVLLRQVTHDMGNLVDQQERDAAVMLPLVMRRVLADKKKSGIEAEPLVWMLVTERDAIKGLA